VQQLRLGRIVIEGLYQRNWQSQQCGLKLFRQLPVRAD
jgi:hypothetical protein